MKIIVLVLAAMLALTGCTAEQTTTEETYTPVVDFASLKGEPRFAVAFMGYGLDEDARNTFVDEYFEKTAEKIPHLDFEGDEWYFIEPRYDEKITVTSLDTNKKQEVTGAFTIKCNLSDLYSNVEISVGDECKFSPQVGGSGMLVKNEFIHDITNYGQN